MQVNLMSDTVTKPSTGMLKAMLRAEVGDDVFREDPSTNALQTYAAELFGHEAALFCPSGTMTNQIAIQIHTGDLGEMICEETSHVYQYETGGYAYNARAAVRLLQGQNGKLTAQQIKEAIRPVYDWLPSSQLVVIENTCNKGGGSYYDLTEIGPISKLCSEQGLNLHLDGARLFNALVETGESTKDWGELFDSISICLSKGLGAPVGSLLIGPRQFIEKARRYRKVMGGGMRQVGILAAAGMYALENNIQRLKQDHLHASILGEALEKLSIVKHIRPVRSNIVLAELEKDALTAAQMISDLASNGILAVAMDTYLIRLVTHLDVTKEMVEYVVEKMSQLDY